MRKIIVFLTLFLFSFNLVSAETNCPFGLVDDPAPGDCGLFIDKDGNNYCDHSEVKNDDTGKKKAVLSEDELKAMSVDDVARFFEIDSQAYANEIGTFLGKSVTKADSLQILHDEDELCAGVAAGIAQALVNGEKVDKETLESHDVISGKDLKTKTVKEVAQIYGIESKDLQSKLSEYLDTSIYAGDSFQSLHDMYDLSPSVVKDIAAEIKEAEATASVVKTVASKTTTASGAKKYKFLFILVSTLVLYLISFLSEKAGYLKLMIHRRIWNMILLLSFLVSAIFGILLILAINFGWFLSIYAFILYWHVEFGTVMVIVTIFHIAWHWPYFTHMMKKRKI